MSPSSELRSDAEMLQLVRARAGERLAGEVRRRRHARVVAGVGIAAIALIASALVLTHGDGGGVEDDGGQVQAGPAVDHPVTGWYVPRSLPEGWKIEDLALVRPEPAVERARAAGDQPCACDQMVWVSDDGRRNIVATEPSVGAVELRRALAPGRPRSVTFERGGVRGAVFHWTGSSSEAGRHTRMVVVSDRSPRRSVQIVGQEKDLDQMQALAVEWKRNQLASLFDDLASTNDRFPPRGFHLTSVGTTRLAQKAPYVRVWLEGPEVGEVFYDLVPPGSRPRVVEASEQSIPGFGPVVRTTDGGSVGLLPGVDVVVGLGDPAPEGTLPQESRLGLASKVLVGALRPATAEAWARFVAEAPFHDDGVLATSLADAVEQAATGAPPATTTVRRDGRRYTGHDVRGLDLAIDLRTTEMQAGVPIAADLLVRNPGRRPRTIDECNTNLQFGLVPEGEQNRALPIHYVIDCYTWPRFAIPPGATVRMAIPGGFRTQQPASARAAAPYRDPLPPGIYRAVLDLPGRPSPVRVVDPRSVRVTASPCPPLPARLAGTGSRPGSMPLERKDVERFAAEADLRLRVLLVGDPPGAADCGRVTAYRDATSFDQFVTLVRG